MCFIFFISVLGTKKKLIKCNSRTKELRISLAANSVIIVHEFFL